jgi:S-adenosylmethionine hydrolase
MLRTPLITLTTDFGTVDGYVGTMKGVILGIIPSVCLVDLTHEIAPQNVREAAFTLYTAYPFFPKYTVHLVVVDPGVGSARLPIAVHTPSGVFVGPDNGVFSYILLREQVGAVTTLADSQYHLPDSSQTFHGRDVFAPVAAHLAAGVPVDSLGPSVPDPVIFELPRLELTSASLVGEVQHIDRFGNIISSIGCLVRDGADLVLKPAFGDVSIVRRYNLDGAEVLVGERQIAGICATYADVAIGKTLALIGSSGFLEIAIREGNAAKQLKVRPGDRVILRTREEV